MFCRASEQDKSVNLSWKRSEAGTILLQVHLTPNARQSGLVRVAHDADGAPVLFLKVRAVPDRSRANVAARDLLANLLKVAKTQITLERGATTRRKLFSVPFSTTELQEKLAALTTDGTNR